MGRSFRFAQTKQEHREGRARASEQPFRSCPDDLTNLLCRLPDRSVGGGRPHRGQGRHPEVG